MGEVSQDGAQDWLESWAEEKRLELESIGCLINIERSKHGSSVLEIYSDENISAICAWDHDNVIEILFIDTQLQEPIVVYDGPCESKNKFLEELGIFKKWLVKKIERSN